MKLYLTRWVPYETRRKIVQMCEEHLASKWEEVRSLTFQPNTPLNTRSHHDLEACTYIQYKCDDTHPFPIFTLKLTDNKVSFIIDSRIHPKTTFKFLSFLEALNYAFPNLELNDLRPGDVFSDAIIEDIPYFEHLHSNVINNKRIDLVKKKIQTLKIYPRHDLYVSLMKDYKPLDYSVPGNWRGELSFWIDMWYRLDPEGFKAEVDELKKN